MRYLRYAEMEQYIIEIIDSFVVDTRSNKMANDPSRHTERNGCDADNVVE